MKLPKLIPTFVLILAAALAACGKSATSADATTDQQLDQAKQDTKQAAQDLQDYTYAQKEAFIAKMQVEQDELNQELAQLSAKIDKASDTVKAEAQPKLDALRAQAADWGAQLDKAKGATESTWTEIKNGSQKAYDATAQALKDSGQWIDQQISSMSTAAPATSAHT